MALLGVSPVSDVRALPIYADDDVEVDIEAIKRAKIDLDLPYRIVPSSASTNGGGRVLAYGKPPWVCDFFLVSEHTDHERLQRALEWVLGEIDHDEEATVAEDTLAVIFGEGTREITPAELASEKAWRAYFDGE